MFRSATGPVAGSVPSKPSTMAVYPTNNAPLRSTDPNQSLSAYPVTKRDVIIGSGRGLPPNKMPPPIPIRQHDPIRYFSINCV